MHWKNAQSKQDSKELKKTRVVEDFMIMEQSNNLDCYDLSRTSKAFQTKVYGVKFAVKNSSQNKTLVVCALVDDLMLECLNYPFVESRIRNITNNKPSESAFQSDAFHRFACWFLLKRITYLQRHRNVRPIYGLYDTSEHSGAKTISQVTKDSLATISRAAHHANTVSQIERSTVPISCVFLTTSIERPPKHRHA